MTEGKANQLAIAAIDANADSIMKVLISCNGYEPKTYKEARYKQLRTNFDSVDRLLMLRVGRLCYNGVMRVESIVDVIEDMYNDPGQMSSVITYSIIRYARGDDMEELVKYLDPEELASSVGSNRYSGGYYIRLDKMDDWWDLILDEYPHRDKLPAEMLNYARFYLGRYDEIDTSAGIAYHKVELVSPTKLVIPLSLVPYLVEKGCIRRIVGACHSSFCKNYPDAVWLDKDFVRRVDKTMFDSTRSGYKKLVKRIQDIVGLPPTPISAAYNKNHFLADYKKAVLG